MDSSVDGSVGTLKSEAVCMCLQSTGESVTNLGGALRAARLAGRVSLSRMADLTSYSKPYLGQLETGRREVRPEHVAAYERALGIRVDLRSRTVDLVDIELIRQGADVLTMLGLRHGGMAVVEMARTQWEWTTTLLNRPMHDDVRSELGGQAARIADRVAWSFGDMGRAAKAVTFYEAALELAADDAAVSDAVCVDLANHLTGSEQPDEALAVLDRIESPSAVIRFTAHSARARAWATLGRWREAEKEIDLADEAHARVDLAALPPTHAPYASGHAAHAHREAGYALSILAALGERRAVVPAVDRLTRAIDAFGPERANAVANCELRLAQI